MRTASVLASVLLIAACQKKVEPAGQTGSGSGSAGSQAKPRTTLDIKLPPLSGKPPVKTSAPLTKDQLEKIATTRFEDFTLEVNKFPIRVAIRQRATTRPKMSVNIHVSNCTEVYKCIPLTLDTWRAEEAALKKLLVDSKLVDRPDSVFEIGATSIGGVPIISVYQGGYFFGKDETGDVGNYSLAYSLFYNDGNNVLRVTVSFSDDPLGSLAKLQEALPRQFLEKVAVSFLDAYGQAWAN